MPPPEPGPLRALSDGLQAWSKETDAFFHALEVRLGEACQQLEKLEHPDEAVQGAPASATAADTLQASAQEVAAIQAEREQFQQELAQRTAALLEAEERLRSQEKHFRVELDAIRRRAQTLESELNATKEEVEVLRSQLQARHEEGTHTSPAQTAPREDKTDTALSVPDIPAHDDAGHKMKTGEILVQEGVLSPQQLQKVLEEQAKSPHIRLGTLAIRAGFTNEALVAKVLAAQLHMPYADLSSVPIDRAAVHVLSSHLARLHKCIALNREGNNLTVAMANPLDLIALEDIELATRLHIIPVVAASTAIETALERYYPQTG